MTRTDPHPTRMSRSLALAVILPQLENMGMTSVNGPRVPMAPRYLISYDERPERADGLVIQTFPSRAMETQPIGLRTAAARALPQALAQELRDLPLEGVEIVDIDVDTERSEVYVRVNDYFDVDDPGLGWMPGFGPSQRA